MTKHRKLALLLSLPSILGAVLLGAGCAERAVTSDPALMNPERTSKSAGGTDDIYDAVQEALRSMVSSPRLRAEPGNRIMLYEIVNSTGIPDYDSQIIYNDFLSHLTNTAPDRFVFLERRGGEAGGEAVQHDLDLTIELRQLPAANSKTIQYNFKLTNLKSEIVWTYAKDIKKRA